MSALADCPRCLAAIFGMGSPFIAMEALSSTAMSHGITRAELIARIHAGHEEES